MAVRTYAPVGQTPILTVRLTRDHLSAIGGLTPDGRLFMRFQDHLLKKLCRENFALIRENWQDLTTSFVRARQSRLDPTHGITTIMP